MVKVLVHDPPSASLAAGALAPLPHDPSHGSADNEVSKKRKESPAMKKAIPEKKKRKKDPIAPKKAMTAFVFFAVAKRFEIKDSNQDKSFGEIVSSLGWPGRKYPTTRRLNGKRRRSRTTFVSE